MTNGRFGVVSVNWSERVPLSVAFDIHSNEEAVREGRRRRRRHDEGLFVAAGRGQSVKLYWTSGQIPELKGLPWEKREEVVEAAIFTVPLTLRDLGVVCGIFVPFTVVSFLLTVFVWKGTIYVWLPLAVFGLNALFLNLARPRMRELVQARASAAPGGDPTDD